MIFHDTFREYPARYQKAARRFYFVAIIAFTASLALYFPGNVKNERWLLIIIDAVSTLFVYTSLILYLTNVTGFRFGTFVYTYSALLNCIFSSWYYYGYSADMTDNVLVTTCFYCVNLVAGGFCVGYKHAWIAAILYLFSFGPLLYISDDPFMNQNAVIIIFLVVALAAGVSWFLYLLEKSYLQELAFMEEINVKDRMLAEQQHKILNEKLSGKQKEIMAKTMFLLESAEKNNDFINKLAQVRNRIRKSDQKLFDEIIQSHRVNHNENYWKEFETTFIEVHRDFFKTLNQFCPGLSPAELRLAAFIHLGLSSKQIADLISNTPESIDVARSRLRNKLKIPANANLKSFLLNI